MQSPQPAVGQADYWGRNPTVSLGCTCVPYSSKSKNSLVEIERVHLYVYDQGDGNQLC